MNPPQFDMNAAFAEQQRIQMIESYRQQAVLHAMTALMIHALKEDENADADRVAKQAKRFGDALVNVLFES